MIAAELLTLIIMLSIWQLVVVVRRRRYATRAREAFAWRCARLSMGIQTKVRMLSLTLPHLAFAAACTSLTYFLQCAGLRPHSIAFIVSTEPWLSSGLPAMRTLLALSTAASTKQRIACLKYWVIWAAAHLAVGLLLAIPLLSRLLLSTLAFILPAHGRGHELVFYACIWLQLPGNRGLNAAYALAAPRIQSRAS